MNFTHSTDIIGMTLEATDGQFGRCKDFLFDDRHWTVRYLVADTGKWLPGRQVLVSPISIDPKLSTTKRFYVDLPKSKLEAGPRLEEHAPVGRQYELRYAQHFGYGYYWSGASTWGTALVPRALVNVELPQPKQNESEGNPHLRSAKEVSGYEIQALDGPLGKLDSYILEREAWKIRYLVIETGTWLSGRKVLISPDWVRTVEWDRQQVGVDMKQASIKNSPELDPAMLNRECENIMYDYYGRPRYWEHTERHTA